MDLLGKTSELGELVANLIRVGEVTSVDAEAFTARVRFEDREDVESYDLSVLVRRSLRTKDYDLPSVGEDVLCLFLPTGVEDGFILGAYYPEPVERPADREGVTVREFEDGTRVEYDQAAHRLTVDVPEGGGEVVVNAPRVTISAGKIDLGEGSLEPSVLGDQLAAWVKDELAQWLNNHQHIGNLGAPTSGALLAPAGPFSPGTAGPGGSVYSSKNRGQ